MGSNYVSVLFVLCAALLLSPGCSRSASGNAASSISITSPADGSRVNRDAVFVSGEFSSSSSDFGVAVNDLPAAVQGDKFYAYVPVRKPGENVIFAKLIDSRGGSTEKAISVWRESESQPLILSANILSGTPPLTVRFSISISSPNPVSLYQVDFDGDGEFDYSSGKCGEIVWTYNNPGAFAVNATVIDSSGKSYSDQATIAVIDPAEINAALVSRWNEFTAALREKNISGALSCLDEDIRPGYEQIFYVLADKLPAIFSQPEQLKLVYMREGTAVYNNMIDEKGAKMSYPVSFVKDKNGFWKIRSF